MKTAAVPHTAFSLAEEKEIRLAVDRRYGKACKNLDETLLAPTLRAHRGDDDAARKFLAELKVKILFEDCEFLRSRRLRESYDRANREWELAKSSMKKITKKSRELAKLLDVHQQQLARLPITHYPTDEPQRPSRRDPMRSRGDELLTKVYEKIGGAWSPTNGPAVSPQADLRMIVSQVSESCDVHLFDSRGFGVYNHGLTRFLEGLADHLDRSRSEGAWDYALWMALGPTIMAGWSSSKSKPLVGTSRNLPAAGVILAARLIVRVRAFVKSGYRCLPFDGSKLPAGRRSYDDVVQAFVEAALGLSSSSARKCVDASKKYWSRHPPAPGCRPVLPLT